MSIWSEVFLGVIALATLTMAVVQVAIVAYGWTLARRVDRVLDRMEREIAPLAGSLNAIARDAARMTAAAAGQVERVDRLVTNLTVKVDQTASAIQTALSYPLREGAAAMEGIRAVMAFVRELAKHDAPGRSRTEEDETLFIG